MGWLFAAVILTLFLFMKISVQVNWRDDLAILARIGFFPIRILPAKSKKIKLSDYKIQKFRKNQAKAEKKARRNAEKKSAHASSHEEKRSQDAADEAAPKRDALGLVKKLLRVAQVFLRRFGRHLRIDLRRMVLVVATGDAAQTAIQFGAICGSVQCVLELLDQCMHLKLPENFSENVRVEPDFIGEKTKVSLDIRCSLRVWQLFDLLFRSAWQFLKQ